MRVNFEHKVARTQKAQSSTGSTRKAVDTAAIQDLQRKAGNRATAALFARQSDAVQRYKITAAYTLGGAQGTEFFRSNALDVSTGTYTRRRIESGPVGLLATIESFDPAGNTWVPGATVATATPPVRISKTRKFAIPNTGGESQVAYMEPAEIAATNVRLNGQGATVRIQQLSGRLTPNGKTAMRQVTGVLNASHQPNARVGIGTLLRTDQKWFNSMCHAFAEYASPTATQDTTDPRTPGTKKNKSANPRPGQKYLFKGPDDPVLEMSIADFDDALQRLASIDLLLRDVGLDNTVANVVKQHGVKGLGEYRTLIPGWGDHSEAVISKDGPDTLTFANFNRNSELMGVFGVHIRQLARNDDQFKTDLLQLRADEDQMLGHSTAAFLDTDIKNMLIFIRAKLLALIANYDNALSQTLTDLNTAKTMIQGELFYFDMFGPTSQSFQTRYQDAGNRERRRSTGRLPSLPNPLDCP